MHFLSVAERELRVAARKRSTFRVRMFTSGSALLVAAFSLWFVTLLGSKPATGGQLFSTLSWLTLISACLVGTALTADSINEERNNGTLGLLFLTALRGPWIALGKLTGHGLLAVYSIFSTVPVMALAALLGGVAVEALAKTALVLLLTLFLALNVGMLASTLLRRTWVAGAVALLFLALLLLGAPLASLILLQNGYVDWSQWVVLFSPSYSLQMAGPTGVMLPTNHLWLALGIQFGLALSAFGLVVRLLPHVWRERVPGARVSWLRARWRQVSFGSAETRLVLRRRLLQNNPILWLSSRQRFGAVVPAFLFLVLAAAGSRIGAQIPPAGGPTDFVRPMIGWIITLPPLYMALCFWLAAAVSERFAVDRKNGALELIASTPLTTKEIVRGRWLGMLRRFWGAASLLLGLHCFVLYYIATAIRLEGGVPDFSFVRLIQRALAHLFFAPTIPNDVAPFYVACLAVIAAAFLIVVLWIALGWLGLGLSLKLRRTVLVPFLSILLLALPPIPLFAASVSLLDDKTLFASNLFLGLFRLGATGFFIVLCNAIIWLVLARRWTYRLLRPGEVPRRER